MDAGRQTAAEDAQGSIAVVQWHRVHVHAAAAVRRVRPNHRSEAHPPLAVAPLAAKNAAAAADDALPGAMMAPQDMLLQLLDPNPKNICRRCCMVLGSVGTVCCVHRCNAVGACHNKKSVHTYRVHTDTNSQQ